MPKIRVLIADDHAILREGVRALLAACADIEVVGQAGDGQAAIDAAPGKGVRIALTVPLKREVPRV